MPCGCSGGKRTTGQWKLTKADGSTAIYQTQVQANAQNIREGKTGKVEPVLASK